MKTPYDQCLTQECARETYFEGKCLMCSRDDPRVIRIAQDNQDMGGSIIEGAIRQNIQNILLKERSK